MISNKSQNLFPLVLILEHVLNQDTVFIHGLLRKKIYLIAIFRHLKFFKLFICNKCFETKKKIIRLI